MAVTYALRAPYVGNYGGGTIAYGPYSTGFDVGVALTAGGGTITTSDATLAEALDKYPPLYRSSGDPASLVAGIAMRQRSVSVGESLATSEVAMEVRRSNEAYARWQRLADGSELAGSGSLAPSVVPSVATVAADVAGIDARVGVAESGALNALSVSGVDRSGVSDSAAGMAAAMAAAAAAGRPLLVPYGTYRSLSGLTVPAPGLTLILDDAELDFSDIVATGTGITAAGSLGSWVNANAVAFGATAITGAAGVETGFSSGDIIKLRSTDVYDPGRTSSTCAEQGVVLSTASGQINLRSPVMGSYSTGVQVAKITRSNLTIKGTGRITGGGSGSSHVGVKAKWIDALRIDGPKIEFRDCESIAVYLWDCVDFEIAHTDVQGSNNTTGYGVSVANACQFGRVHHNHFRDCRHATSTNNSTTDNGGQPRHITFDHNEVRDSRTAGDAMDCHAAAEYITFDGNRIYDAANNGINIECPKATVINNQIYGAGAYGIYLFNCAAAAAEYDCRGNQVYDATQYGIRYAAVAAGGSSAPTLLDISDNKIVRSGFSAIYADPSTLHRIVGAKINRNTTVACTPNDTLGTIYVLKADASEVCDNTLLAQPDDKIGVRLNDFTRGKWSGNVVNFVSAATVRGCYGVGVVGSVALGNMVRNAGGAGGKGLELDATSSGCTVDAGGLRGGATTPLTLNGIVHTVVNDGEDIEFYSTDAAKTLTPFTSPKHLLHTATLAGARNVTISTTGAYKGMRFRVTRTGGGAFNVTVAGVRTLATGQWCEMTFDGSAWVTSAFGSL